jgi:hypothetical protein
VTTAGSVDALPAVVFLPIQLLRLDERCNQRPELEGQGQ